jgi:hypothetical protein
MRGLPRVAARDTHRVRRWDVVVLGGALPGLIAAVRLGQRGERVLIVEEAGVAEVAALLREPFLMTDAAGDGVLGSCLRGLGVALIDQRRFGLDELAVQVVLPDARIDVGRAALFAAELSAWGLAKPDDARDLVRALEQAAQAERQAMLEAPGVGPARRRRGPEDPAAATVAAGLARGWPREAAEAPAAVAGVLAAIARGLSQLGAAPASPESRARLVGALCSGAAVLRTGDGFREMIRRRAEAVFAEFRTIDQAFSFASVAGQPAIVLADSQEILAGRALVLNAPRAAIAAVAGAGAPPALRAPDPTLRRVLRHYRGPHEVFPDAMGDRVICLPDPQGPEPPIVTLRRHPPDAAGTTDLVAAAVGPADAPADAMQAWIERVVRTLLPFSDERLRGRPISDPTWDSDLLLSDPIAGGWPQAAASRLSARPAIHELDRSVLGGLGFEGDLLLGWQAADAIASDLL